MCFSFAAKWNSLSIATWHCTSSGSPLDCIWYPYIHTRPYTHGYVCTCAHIIFRFKHLKCVRSVWEFARLIIYGVTWKGDIFSNPKHWINLSAHQESWDPRAWPVSQSPVVGTPLNSVLDQRSIQLTCSGTHANREIYSWVSTPLLTTGDC